MPPSRTARPLWALACLAFAAPLLAQNTEPTPAPAPAATPAPSPAPARPSPPAAAPGQRVEITGGRDSDTDQRRQSTAAKIVIGREEIDKFGDATLGEVLRRLPGVTIPAGPLGRGGPPRLRGLGSGYTQLLIDGQRVPPGFSLEQLSPEQVERIEILRAPTAETGARAIAGTINIVTREGFRRRLNELRVGAGFQNGDVTPGINWTRNDTVDDLTYNVSLALFRPENHSESLTDTTLTDRASGATVQDDRSRTRSEERRTGVALNGRLQWRLGAAGDSLMLMPSMFHSEGASERRFTLAQGQPPPPPLSPLPLYDLGDGRTDSRFTSTRLNAVWRQRLGAGGPRLELNAGVGRAQSAVASSRNEFRAPPSSASGPLLLRRTDDVSRAEETSGSLTLKLSGLTGGEPGREHSLVGGLEIEAVERDETRTLVDNGTPLLADFGDNFGAATLRTAVYLQDEWALNPNWALHAGARWEGIRTQGDAGANAADARPVNRSSVFTPLVHLLWKPDPKKRDQVRLSLTRSYRSPGVQALIARPVINGRYAASGPNTATGPDSAGNPALRPELATGIDLAFERYLEGGGVLSANLFHRNISDLIRRVVTLETVSWSPVQRYVGRQQNIGDAVTQGLELEAKYRLDQLVDDAPRVEMRHNLALFASRVKGIPGPDNRLDEQAKGTLNLGADYRLRAAPFTFGGNLNVVPGYRTQTAVDRAVRVNTRRVLDLYGLWTVSPEFGVRVLANNLGARDNESQTEADLVEPLTQAAQRELARTVTGGQTLWQLRLEFKL